MVNSWLNKLSFFFTDSSEFPGIVFYQDPIVHEVITSEEVVIEGPGITLTIPENWLSPEEEPVTLFIHPFSGPFDLPDDYESASPAYLIRHSRRVKFQKNVAVKIQHYACLESEKDCDNMAFLAASTTPKLRGSRSVYVFQKILEMGMFRPGSQVGEITLRHFCIIKTGSKGECLFISCLYIYCVIIGNSPLYSARLYRSLSQNLAIFCICLSQKVYTKVLTCDNKL